MTREGAAALAVAALLVAGGIGVAVVVDGDGIRPAPSAGNPVAAPEGSLSVGVPELAASYNPFDLRARTPAGRQVLSVVLPQLFDVSPEGVVEGRLADADSVEIEGLEVRFRLRDGARWSDGVPITAADLSFTLELIRSGTWPGPVAGYDRIETLTGEGRDVQLRFSERFPGWQRLFSGDDYVLPRHRLADVDDLRGAWATGPDVAGGPYRFTGWTPGLDVVLTANPEWWGDGPGVESLHVLTVPDVTTLQQLFDRGEVHVAWFPAFTDRVRQTEAIEDADVAVGPPGGHVVSVYLQTDRVDEEHRVAALDLVDRTRFTRVLLEGDAEVATSWGRLERDPGWPEWFLDPGTAEAASRERMVFAVSDQEPMAGLLLRAVQRRARSTPLTFDAARVLAERLDGEWLASGEFDVAVVDEFQWPHPCWACRWGSGAVGTTNWSRVEGLDDLVSRADAGDAGAGSAVERHLQEIGALLPMWRPAAVVASRGVDGIAANAWQPGPFYRPEHWRLSSGG